MADAHKRFGDIISSVLKQKMKHYLTGHINSEIVRLHHNLPKVKGKFNVKEEEGGPTNVMGTSSSVSGTGGIDTFDPLLGKLARRKRPAKGQV
jgi:hypothetical protein